MNRIEIRNYYRKCVGLISLMSSILLLVVSFLAIYIADFDEMDVEEGTGVLALNGLYAIFVLGFLFAVFAFITGIIAVKGNSEGIFTFARINCVLVTVISAIAFVISIYVVRNQDIEWDGEKRAVAAVYLIASLLAAIFAIATVVLSHKGMQYYDKAKRLAKDVPDMDIQRPERVKTGISLVCVSILNLSVAFLCYYFSNMIKIFDKYLVEENDMYATLFFGMFVIGAVIAAYTVITGVSLLFVKTEKLKRICLGAVWANIAYIAVFVVCAVVAMTRDFVKSQYPDVSYFIFAFILVACAIGYLLPSIRGFRKTN
ncbi:MAG: hypothetical protein SPF70_05535 [Lachnospiraceae bacterium]|nr:hypothetical protein [Lachnospiraceae bacterium]